MDTRFILLDMIDDNPYQTRLQRDAPHIASLAADIKQNTMLQVPIGRYVDENKKLVNFVYADANNSHVQLAFGHNRCAAYRLLSQEDPQYERLPVYIRNLSDEEMAIMAWSENESRKQLDPIERAKAIQRFTVSFGWTQQVIADKIHLDRSTIANLLRLLTLPAAILDDVHAGILSQRQAMALLPVYELTQTQSLALNQNASFCDFISLARSGQLSSDTIRDKLTVYIDSVEHLNGKQLGIFETPVVENIQQPEPAIEAETEEVFDLEITDAEAIYQDKNEADEVENISTPEYKSIVTPPMPAPAAIDPPAPEQNVCAQTIKPEPAPAKTEQPVVHLEDLKPTDDSVVFSITWNGAMAVVGLRKGEGNPLIRALFNLTVEQIPWVLTDMKKELSII